MASEYPPSHKNGMSILMSEVKLAIKKLKPFKAAGFDGMLDKVPQTGDDVLVPEMHNICDMVWASEQAPVEWLKQWLYVVQRKKIRSTAKTIAHCRC